MTPNSAVVGILFGYLPSGFAARLAFGVFGSTVAPVAHGGCSTRIFAADFCKLRSQHCQRTRTNRPQPIKPTPVSWLTRGPSGNSFSISTRSANPAIQSKFMRPPTNKSPISIQQHPRQNAPCHAPGAHRAERTLPPISREKLHWRPAMLQARLLPRRQLINAGGEQQTRPREQRSRWPSFRKAVRPDRDPIEARSRSG